MITENKPIVLPSTYRYFQRLSFAALMTVALFSFDDLSAAETRSDTKDDSSVLSAVAKDLAIAVLKGIAKQSWTIFVIRACKDANFREQNVDSKLRGLVQSLDNQRVLLTWAHQAVLQCAPAVDESQTLVTLRGPVSGARPAMPSTSAPLPAPPPVVASIAEEVDKVIEREKDQTVTLIASAAAAAGRGDSDGLTSYLSQLNSFAKPQRRNVEASSRVNKEGLDFYHRGALQDAASLFKSAVELDPGNVEARNNWAFMLILMRSDEDAALILVEVLKASPYRASAWLNAAQILASTPYENLAVGSILIADRYSSNRSTLHGSLEKMLADDRTSAAWRLVVKKALDVIDGRLALPL